MTKIPSRQKKVPFRPRFAGSFEGYAYNAVKKIYPKLAAEWEFDDLLHEAVIVFLVCRERFAGKVDNPAWFMSLFQRALNWRFVDLQRGQFSYIPIEDLAESDEPATELDAGFCWRVLQELPGDMQELLAALNLGDATVLATLKHRVADMAAADNQTLMTKEN